MSVFIFQFSGCIFLSLYSWFICKLVQSFDGLGLASRPRIGLFQLWDLQLWDLQLQDLQLQDLQVYIPKFTFLVLWYSWFKVLQSFGGLGLASRPRIGFFQLSDFRFQIPDFRLQISDFRFQFSDFRFQISDFRFQFSDSRFQIPDSRFQIPVFRFQISDFIFQIPDCRFQN